MDRELRFLLEQGPTSVKELSRLSGKSTSTIYKQLQDPEVQSQDAKGGRLFFVTPTETSANVALDTKAPKGGTSPTPAPSNAPAQLKRGRKATFAGKRLLHVGPLGEGGKPYNYRRKDSHGYRSLEIIAKHPGITTEDFVAKGGRLNDLRWDVTHGAVRAE